MLTPKFSTKRVLGLSLAAALAVAGTVALAGNSQAATVASLKLGPATGSSAGGTIVTITGKGFQNAAGASLVGAIYFSTSTCAVANKTTNAATSINVVSATKIDVTTPVLALTASKPTLYNLCVDDTADANVVGAGKFTSYLAPYVNTAGLSTTSGASYGGGTLVITGENFTTKTTATVNSLPLTNVKVVVGSGTSASGNLGDDTLTGTLPAGTGATKSVVVTSEGGNVTATQTFSFVPAVKVSPAFGNGTVGNVIQLTGTGFLAHTPWVSTATASSSAVAFVPAKTNYISGTTTIAQSTALMCTNIQVESNTALSCQAPALNTVALAGPYTVEIIDWNATVISGVTAVSSSATYSVGAF